MFIYSLCFYWIAPSDLFAYVRTLLYLCTRIAIIKKYMSKRCYSYLLYVFSLILCFSCVACEPSEELASESAITIYYHVPYSNLTSFVNNDLREADEALLTLPSLDKTTILFAKHKFTEIGIDPNVYVLCKKIVEQGEVKNILLREYHLSEVNYTTAEGLATLLRDVQSFSKSKRYGMIISSHGDGWLPQRAPSSTPDRRKLFGAGNHKQYDTSFATLAEAVSATEKPWEFLLIDACNCQNIEVAYDLRNAFRYLIGSTTEIVDKGQDYLAALPALVNQQWGALCQSYKASCEDYKEWKSATLSVIDCSQMDEMAAIVKLLHQSGADSLIVRSDLQPLDGYDMYRYGYNIFYDFADYYRGLSADTLLLSQFEHQLAALVLAEAHTASYNSVYFPINYMRPLRVSSGLSCSAPCKEYFRLWQETNWYKATH